MERLTIKELAPYLPYGLKGRVDKETYLQEENERIGELKTIDLADHNYELAVYGELGYFLCDISDFKPLLRPLSYLTEEIEHNGERFVPYQRLYQFASNMGIHKGTFEHMLDNIIEGSTHITEMPYYLVKNLFEWHFDVFGLIDRGLALPIEGKEVEGE